MAYFYDSFMDHRRQQWMKSIAYVEVQVDSTWHRGDISQKQIDGDSLVIMATFPTLDDLTCTIAASRLIDVRGEVASYQQRTIQKNAGQGTMIKITIPIYEVTA